MTFNARTGTFLKVNQPLMKNGCPDIVGAYKGKWVGLEVKADTKQSESQKAFQEGVEKSGGVYFLVRSVDDVAKALASLKPLEERMSDMGLVRAGPDL